MLGNPAPLIFDAGTGYPGQAQARSKLLTLDGGQRRLAVDADNGKGLTGTIRRGDTQDSHRSGTDAGTRGLVGLTKQMAP